MREVFPEADWHMFLRTKKTDVDRFEPMVEEATLSRAALRVATRLIECGDPERTAQDFCDSLVSASTHLRLCWLWFGEPSVTRVKPMVYAGPASAYAQTFEVERNVFTKHGPFFQALDGYPTVNFDISKNCLFEPWRRAAREHDIGSAIAVRLSSGIDDRVGVLVLYSGRQSYFRAVGTGVFEALGPLLGAVMAQTHRSAELAESASRDPMTGAFNRRYADQVHKDLVRMQDDAPPVGVLLIDIDHFKQVNDGFGHSSGDAVIVETVRRIGAVLRDSDSVARWGGEEFLVWLPGAQGDGTLATAERIRRSMEDNPFVLPNGASLRVTVSVGAAEARVAEPIDDAIARADAALYFSKQNGRNRVTVSEICGVNVHSRSAG